MAKHSSHILDMARKGAEHRYEELKAEISALMKHFPHLGGRKSAAGAASASRKAAVAAGPGESAPGKRRTMSAKARKAISAAQKARWAKQRAAEKK